MKITSRLIDNLRRLINGEPLPYSSLPQSLSTPLCNEGLVTVIANGRGRSLRAANTEALKMALPKYSEAFVDLDFAKELIAGGSRASQAALSGNSKIREERSCPGFLVNSYDRVECSLNGNPFIVEPLRGSAVYVAEWQEFTVPSDVLIVGVENMENFLRIHEQRRLIDTFLSEVERGVLFVARYAFSSDLMHWLEAIPNRYLHFGDFDLAGISIFLSQFKPYVGERGTFLIPWDVEERIRVGSRVRYDDQYVRYAGLTAADIDLNRLIELIHRYRRCYDQEGYIER